MWELFRHLFHNDHGEWTALFAVFGVVPTLVLLLKTRVQRAWHSWRGENLLCQETHRCCEHEEVVCADELVATVFTREEVQRLLTFIPVPDDRLAWSEEDIYFLVWVMARAEFDPAKDGVRIRRDEKHQ